MKDLLIDYCIDDAAERERERERDIECQSL
jgi:hypothetical protein